MSKYYYGAWNNFLQLNWPLRFLLELISIVVILILIFRSLEKIDTKKLLKPGFIGVVVCITELIYLIGRNSSIAIRLDNAVVDWGNKMTRPNKKRTGIYTVIIIFFLFLYFGAIFTDLPVADNMPQYYLQGFNEFRKKCMIYEEVLSKGCENYPPLFEKKEIIEVSEITEEESSEDEIIVNMYLLLNERGRGGSNIRKTPDLNGEIVIGIREDAVLLYMDEYEYDGERYWLKVYLPEKNIEGWLSGKLVETEQIEAIIGK